MHDEIRKFLLTGVISDTDVVKTRERLISAVEANMRDEGYVPDLDKEPQFTREYVADTERFNFVLTVYGVYVGKDKAWATGGVMGGKTIMKSIPATK
jgi:hypothetical protein